MAYAMAAPRLLDIAGRRRWLEVALDYRCNLRCIGCHACHDDGTRISSEDAARLMREGRERGIESLWIGGGEPTLRDDLLSIVKTARGLGYARVLVQTNGMRLAYAKYADALVAAGVTHVSVNVKSHRADVHDRLSRADGCHALLVDALRGLAARDVAVSADVLLTRSTIADLPDVVPFYAALGVRRFVLWLLSAADVSERDVVDEIPRIAELVPYLARAAEAARAAGVALVSLHTPPCTLPHELRALFEPASSLDLIVVGPDGRAFPLEDSPFEGGAYVAACAACSVRSRCGGPRADYLRVHGDAEFSAL
jgi:MoaA/NifB/PqqE/SkfB family radical SAM enzyme